MVRFTIRDLLWLTLVVGISIGWWLDSRRLSKRIEFLREHVPPFGSFPVDLPPSTDVTRLTDRDGLNMVSVHADFKGDHSMSIAADAIAIQIPENRDGVDRGDSRYCWNDRL